MNAEWIIIPDKRFLEILKDEEPLKDCFDKNKMNVLHPNIKKLTTLWFDWNIKDVTGIEYFTELKELGCSSNNIVHLDLSKNTALTSLSCQYNKLTTLDLPKNASLTEINCDNNELTSLDVSMYSDLKSLKCEGNKLTELLLPEGSLETLDCSNNQLTTLSFPNSIKELRCSTNKLTSLTLSRHSKMDLLLCDNNLMTSIILKSKTLTWISCDNNKLITLDVRQCPNLEGINCEKNSLTKIEVLNNPKLYSLECAKNKITMLDLQNNKELIYLDCSNNKLSLINITNNKKLREFSHVNNSKNIIITGSLFNPEDYKSVKGYDALLKLDSKIETIYSEIVSQWDTDEITQLISHYGKIAITHREERREMGETENYQRYLQNEILQKLVQFILKQKPNFNEAQLLQFYDSYPKNHRNSKYSLVECSDYPILPAFMDLLVQQYKNKEVPDGIRKILMKEKAYCIDSYNWGDYFYTPARKKSMFNKINKILGIIREEIDPPKVEVVEYNSPEPTLESVTLFRHGVFSFVNTDENGGFGFFEALPFGMEEHYLPVLHRIAQILKKPISNDIQELEAIYIQFLKDFEGIIERMQLAKGQYAVPIMEHDLGLDITEYHTAFKVNKAYTITALHLELIRYPTWDIWLDNYNEWEGDEVEKSRDAIRENHHKQVNTMSPSPFPVILCNPKKPYGECEDITTDLASYGVVEDDDEATSDRVYKVFHTMHTALQCLAWYGSYLGDQPRFEPPKGIFTDKTLVISGVFSMSREELKAKIMNNGGKVGSSISKNTDFLVIGDKMGPAKKEKAESLGVKMISEEVFLRMIE